MFKATIALSCLVMCSELGTPSSPTAEQLIDKLLKRDQELISLAATYCEIPDEKGKGTFKEAVRGYSRRRVAFRPPNWFFRDNAHGSIMSDWKQDPFRKTLLIKHGRSRVLEHLSRVVFESRISADEGAPPEVQSELLFLALCWWPYSEWAPQDFAGRPWSMTKLLAEGGYQLRSETVLLGDRRCLLLEKPRVDELWLDSAEPYCVLRRNIYNPTTGALGWRCDYANYTHYGGSIWLPHAFTNQHFDSYATEPHRTRRVIDATFELVDVRVNEKVTEDDFQMAVPQGAIRKESRNGVEAAVPLKSGQREHIESIGEWAAGVIRQSGPPNSGVDFPFSLLSVAVAGLAVGFGLTMSWPLAIVSYIAAAVRRRGSVERL